MIKKKPWLTPNFEILSSNTVNGGANAALHEGLVTNTEPAASIGHPNQFFLYFNPKFAYIVNYTKAHYHS